MALKGEVEFFSGQGGQFLTDEDAMDVGRDRVPRWAIMLCCALVVVAFLGALATRQRHAPLATPVDAPAPGVVGFGQLGPALRFDGAAADALDLLVHLDRLYVLRAGAISVFDQDTKHVESMPMTGAFALRYQSSARLALDPGADRLWVIDSNASSAQVLELNADRLEPLRQVTVPMAVHDATAMDGHLYLATSSGLADLAPAARTVAILPAVRGPISAVAADPARGRILALDVSTPGSVVVVSVGRVANRRTFGELIKGSIAVVGDQIWVGGYGGGLRGGYRAIVGRLDPTTLAPVQTSAVALQVDRVDVTPGIRVFWVTTNRPGLWCVDAGTGNIVEQWPTAQAPVTSATGAGYTIDAGTVVPLVMDGCEG